LVDSRIEAVASVTVGPRSAVQPLDVVRSVDPALVVLGLGLGDLGPLGSVAIAAAGVVVRGAAMPTALALGHSAAVGSRRWVRDSAGVDSAGPPGSDPAASATTAVVLDSVHRVGSERAAAGRPEFVERT